MSQPVVTVRPDTTVKQAADLLARHGFTALPVVDDDEQVLGVVTEADLVAGRFPPDPRFRRPDDDRRTTPPRLVGEVMTAPAETVGSGTDVAELATEMVQRRRRAIPIVDGERLVGIVTRRDLVKVLRRSDLDIAGDVRHHLTIFGGAGRYAVVVRDGEATITDQYDDADDRHVAQVIAEAVPGVIRARVEVAAE